MAREIKFRVWTGLIMIYPEVIDFEGQRSMDYYNWYDHYCGESYSFKEFPLMQYTGLKDKNGKEIYEGDIFRIEEDAKEVDEVDRIFYVIIVWVQEWTMFCTLRGDEYHDYIKNGIKALDEPMFWTYTLEDTNSRKHFLCGNIYQNPELLK